METAFSGEQGPKICKAEECSIWRGVRTRLTFGPAASAFPGWSADGKWIAYFSFRDGKYDLYRKPSDGSGAEELLVSDDNQTIAINDWSRDWRSCQSKEEAPCYRDSSAAIARHSARPATLTSQTPPVKV